MTGPDDEVYGCSEDEDLVTAAAAEWEATPNPTEVCIQTKDGERFDCYPSAAEATTALGTITVAPEAPPTSPSASASPPGTPSASEGPAPPAAAYCLTDPQGNQPLCFETKAEADAAMKGLDTEVTEREWCLTPTLPEPEPTPTPTPIAVGELRSGDSLGVAGSVGQHERIGLAEPLAHPRPRRGVPAAGLHRRRPAPVPVRHEGGRGGLARGDRRDRGAYPVLRRGQRG